VNDRLSCLGTPCDTLPSTVAALESENCTSEYCAAPSAATVSSSDTDGDDADSLVELLTLDAAADDDAGNAKWLTKKRVELVEFPNQTLVPAAHKSSFLSKQLFLTHNDICLSQIRRSLPLPTTPPLREIAAAVSADSGVDSRQTHRLVKAAFATPAAVEATLSKLNAGKSGVDVIIRQQAANSGGVSPTPEKPPFIYEVIKLIDISHFSNW